MSNERTMFTSESVTEGHPDKVADAVSDAILDHILEKDPAGRVACETFLHTGCAHIAGQISTSVYVDIPRVVRQTIVDIGYTDAEYGLDGRTCAVLVSLDEQSPDIAMGVDKALEAKEGGMGAADQIESLGAGDQGMMFGYACLETPELMPLPIQLAHRLSRRLAEVRKDGTINYLRPDGKSQVTIEYENGKPLRVENIVVSAQHHPHVSLQQINDDILKHVIKPVVAADLMDANTKIFINPTGKFVIGGPQGDTGLTGRKIIVDTYGGMIPHGGGAFSGKDPTKVDRSGAYAARWVAKNIVGAGLAERAEVALAYAIGVAQPLNININTFGTERMERSQLVALVRKVFDLRPGAIIKTLGLRRPIYRATAAYGHFGRPDLDLPWERLDRVEALRAAAGINGNAVQHPFLSSLKPVSTT